MFTVKRLYQVLSATNTLLLLSDIVLLYYFLVDQSVAL